MTHKEFEEVKARGITNLVLHSAKHGKAKDIKFYLDEGGNIEAKDEDGRTALMLATQNGKIESIKVLLDNGADIEAKKNDGLNPLMHAAWFENLEAMNLLLNAGADIEAKDNDGKTALILATQNKKIESIKLLLDNGADINANDNDGRNVFYNLENEEILEVLRNHRKQSNSCSNETNKSYDEILSIFDDIIGLDSVKDNIQDIINNIKIEKLRNTGKKVSAGHYIFQGNPGTGKTTIARLMDDVFKELGVLSGGHLVEVTREDLVGAYIGHTAKQTKAKLEEAIGGILFIDEAYSLVGEGNDFGQEAIDTIVPFMENHKDDFILIVAGYTDDMREFLDENTGLKSRFTHTINFEDYTNEEMIEIFNIHVKKGKFKLGDGVEEALKKIFQSIKDDSEHFGNGREARKVFDAVVTTLNTRLKDMSDLQSGDERLYLITLEDIPQEYQKLLKVQSPVTLEDAYSKLDDIIGLDSVKDNVRNIINKIKLAKRRNSDEDISAGHYIFQGNPGTGKTTVANIMDDIFGAMGVLKKGHIVEVTREDLVGEYIGKTALKTREKLEEALGGILFIDEAYTLSRGGENDFGKEAIDTIVPFMEEHRNEFVLIVAGYTDDMKKFLDSNTGLKSRFTHTIDFEDYDNEYMFKIFSIFVEKKKFKLEDGVEEAVKTIFQNIRESSKHFGNGRDARKVFDLVCSNMDNRLVNDESIVGDELNLILLEDLNNI